MRVFVLGAEQAVSGAFASACRHIDNYSCGVETRAGLLGEDRFRYPDRHIEIDDRLAWLLGRLDRAHGDAACYVHLRDAREASVARCEAAWSDGILQGYTFGLLARVKKMTPGATPRAVCEDYVDTVHANLRAFLRDKPHAIDMPLGRAAGPFAGLWRAIGAEGDLDAALADLEAAIAALPRPAPGRGPQPPLDPLRHARERRGRARKAVDWLRGAGRSPRG